VNHKNAFVALFAVLVLVISPAHAADTLLGPSCDLKITGGTDKQDFLNFDRVLRKAIQNGDSATAAELSDYPLSVNYGSGVTISIDTPATFQARFDEMFPDYARKAVLDNKPDQLWCNWEGVMYGNGVVWVSLTGKSNSSRYRIAAINLQERPKDANVSKSRKTDYVCVTDKHYVVIDDEDGTHYRYRAWGKSALDDKPDMEIGTGVLGSEGTGLCAYDIWKFKKGDTEFDVMGLGCGGDTDEPQDASGQLQVLIKDQLKQMEWCHR